MQAQSQSESHGQAQAQTQGPHNKNSPGGAANDAALQKRIDSLQAQIESLSKDLGNLGGIQKQDSADLLQSDSWLSFVAQMQERMRVLERTLADLTGRVEQLERYGTDARSNSAGEERRGGSADEQFLAAQVLLQMRKVEEAARAFGEFASSYPNDPRAAEALFYLGESYAVLQDDKKAMKAFLDGYKKNRSSPFAPRLLLRLGQVLAKMKKGEQACRVLREYQKRFGNKDADMTKLAEAELAANSCGS